MSTGKLVTLCSVILILAVLATTMLTSCGPQLQEFNKVDVTTTLPTTTEPVTYVYSDFSIFGTRMGMSLEETQQALNVPIAVRFSESGLVFFAISRTDLDFVNEGLEAAVYFIYDTNTRLCEIQYVTTNDTGFVLDSALAKFDSQYGTHASVNEEGKSNYIWFRDGAYMIITVFDNGQNAISYFAKDYFELTKPDLAQAFNKQIQEG